MQFDISYNDVKVTELAKAQAICDRFEFQGAEFKPDQQRVLRYVVDERIDQEGRWPNALLVDDVPNEHDFKDKNAYWEALFEAFGDKGGKGFESFLREIAPLLEESLFILAVGKDGHNAIGTAWYVDPSGKVEVRNACSD